MAETYLLSLIVPVFNESQTIRRFYDSYVSLNFPDHVHSELLFIDDGSADNSAEIIQDLCESDSRVSLIQFSRNFGKEAALFAGLQHCAGAAAIPIDVDLQDPPEVILDFLRYFELGYDVVLGKRRSRSSDTFWKRFFAKKFYSLINMLADHRLEENVGDFRLLARPVIDAVCSLKENRLFMKGLLGWVGFKTAVVEYDRPSRSAGESKFNGWRLWNFAIEGITSFSTAPLRVWTYFGGFVAIMAFFWAAVMIVQKIVFGNEVAGYPSLIVSVLFMGGIQLIGIGILGEYVGRIYYESKRRPKFIVRKLIRKAGFDEE